MEIKARLGGYRSLRGGLIEPMPRKYAVFDVKESKQLEN